MSTSPTTSSQSDLDLSSLVNQLSASTDFNDLRQKMTKIENSKVSPLPNPTHPLDKGLRRPSQTPTRETREKGILSPYSSPAQVAYEESKEKVNIWNGIVVKNRKSEFVRFEDAEPDHFKLTSNAMASKFEPTTDMEKEIDVVRNSPSCKR